MSDNTSFIDYRRSAHLCDVGAPGLVAAVLVAEDGHSDLVLLVDELVGDRHHMYDATTRQAAHEQLGPLPPRWRARTALAPLRCGRRTKTGAPCRNPVTAPNAACSRHRTAERSHR